MSLMRGVFDHWSKDRLPLAHWLVQRAETRQADYGTGKLMQRITLIYKDGAGRVLPAGCGLIIRNEVRNSIELCVQ